MRSTSTREIEALTARRAHEAEALATGEAQIPDLLAEAERARTVYEQALDATAAALRAWREAADQERGRATGLFANPSTAPLPTAGPVTFGTSGRHTLEAEYDVARGALTLVEEELRAASSAHNDAQQRRQQLQSDLVYLDDLIGQHEVRAAREAAASAPARGWLERIRARVMSAGAT